jgi:hypothetical protein
MRVTEDRIIKLNPNEIFVFGSNTSGRHSKGAARTAMGWGAKFGQAEGLQGRTYGIPTVNASVTQKLSLEKIAKYVDTFIEFAISNPSLTFLVTEIGCGLAGHIVNNIAPLFKKAIEIDNIHLPKKFWRILNHE